MITNCKCCWCHTCCSWLLEEWHTTHRCTEWQKFKVWGL